MKIVGIIIILSMFGACFYVGMEYGADKQAHEDTLKAYESIQKARADERDKQAKTNAITQRKMDDVNATNARLIARINSLQQRKDRADLPEKSRADCKGATGRELSRSDSQFLERLAARADTIRAALKACYDYADKISQ